MIVDEKESDKDNFDEDSSKSEKEFSDKKSDDNISLQIRIGEEGK